jgi:hypothetical protein
MLLGVTLFDPTLHTLCMFHPQNEHTAYCYSVSLNEPQAPAPPSDSPPSPNNPGDVDEYVSKLRTADAKYIKTSTEDLGTQMLEGVMVKGERVTWTRPAGSAEDRPMFFVQEDWTSTDLGLTMLSRRSDSRGNVAVTRMTSLDRSEPDPALFQLPPDYTVVDRGDWK